VSHPLGVVRLAEALPHGDPPAAGEFARCREQVRDFLAREAVPEVRAAIAREAAGVALVATGGTASVLAMMELGLTRFDRNQIEGVALDAARVTDWTARLWALPLAARREITGLPPERADIILFGVAIFEAIMGAFALTPLRVSTRGLRFGALLEAPP
jgi:exopolyphosphatase/guanosine-5'-triphosphate,3'-diphosphate pyrophosphatase